MPSLRAAGVAALCFVGLSLAFQWRGLSGDWLLTDASSVRGLPAWKLDYPAAEPAHGPPDDHVHYFGPYAAFIQQELRRARLPLWNPYVATGVPVVDVMQPALLHPYTLALLVLPFERAITVLGIVRLAVVGFAAFILARVLGCRLPAATVAGIVFMFSSLEMLFRFHPLPNTWAMLPLLVAVSELRFRGASPRRTGAAWSLLALLTLMGGHTQSSVHVLGAAGSYHVLRALSVQPLHSAWLRTAGAVAFVAGCTMIAAVGAAVAWGHVAMVLDGQKMRVLKRFGAYPRLPWDHVLSFLVPGTTSYGWGVVPGYVGMLTLVLVAGGLAARRPFLAWPWIVIGTASLLAAYGAWPVAPLLGALPVVGLADHSRLLVVVDLALALLAARGLESLGESRVQRAMMGSTLVLALALIALGYWPVPRRHQEIFLAIGGVLSVAARWLPARRIVAWVVVALVFADVYGVLAPRPGPDTGRFPPAPTAFAEIRPGLADGRTLIAQSVMPANLNMIYRFATPAAYEPTLSGRTASLLQGAGLQFAMLGLVAPDSVTAGHLRLLNLLGVRHLVLPRPLGDPLLRQRLDELRRTPVAVYRNPEALPRAFAVEATRIARGPEEALSAVLDPEVDLRRTVILEEPVTAAPSAAPSAAEPEVHTDVIDYDAGRADIAVACPAACYVVFSEAFSGGWRAQIDGVAAPVLRADYALIGVPVTAGRHRLVLSYSPRSVLFGGPISIVTVLGLTVAAAVPSAGGGRARSRLG